MWDKKKTVCICVVLPVLLFVILYASGFIAQFMINYNEWNDNGSVFGYETAPKLPSGEIAACIKAMTVVPYNLYGLLFCSVLFGVLIIFVMRMGFGGKGTFDKERNLTYSDKGTYGTSGFMSEPEMNKVLELVSDVSQTKGVILGKLEGKAVCLPEHTRMNRNVAVFGASGSMKSRAYARNVIFQCVARGESLVITDPKSELYGDMKQYLEENDYLVRVFNLVDPENSDSWNCLAEVEGQEIMAQLFCDVIIKNTGSEKGDHFWDNAEMNLLKALVLYVDQGFPPEGKNIGQVYKLLTLNSEKELNSLFDLLPVSHPAKAPYNIFQQAADSVRSGVIIGLGTRLQVFQNKLICKITSYDEISLTLPGQKKCAYFCITSDQDSAFDFLSSLFMSFVFIKLVKYADKYGEGGRLPVPVHILADELANGGCTIADLTKKISTIRSRALSISCIFQNLPQMQNRYPDNKWQEIIGNCDTQLFLGCTDEMTAEFISNRTGEVSVAVSTEAKQLNTMRISDYTPDYRQTSSVGKRKLMTPDEVLRLPLDQALIILRGQKVLKVEKYDYTLHPESRKIKVCRASEHVPEWRRNPEREEADFTSLLKPKPKEKKKRIKKESSVQIQEETDVEWPEGYFSNDSVIVATDKKSIMS
ncbi:MAG: type IV secretory system conjugative DNA transfer family protein [Lachnospiraceae bacterium]|nr:type IV secretory system conjugative DNA transfer family protein [Lachnospiraceae bacterium]MBP3568640.1 type IV secretory system conjugative DNA transfer family protein [Lachnospiraceae bacterium]